MGHDAMAAGWSSTPSAPPLKKVGLEPRGAALAIATGACISASYALLSDHDLQRTQDGRRRSARLSRRLLVPAGISLRRRTDCCRIRRNHHAAIHRLVRPLPGSLIQRRLSIWQMLD